MRELLQAKHPEDFPFEFLHLGVLYICDYDHDGVFTIEDLEKFALWVQINLPSVQMYEFQAQLQSRALAKMIEDMDKKDGEAEILVWVLTHSYSLSKCS